MPTTPKSESNRDKVLKIISDTLTRDDFAKSFASVLSYLKSFQSDLTERLTKSLQLINDKVDARLAQIKDGKDYVLTDADKKEIASKIEVPIVEKTVETIIEKQTPIVTEIVREVALTDTADDIRNKLELLQGDERLKAEAISGLETLIEDIKALKARPSGGHGMSPSGPTLMVGGAKKGRALNLNFKAGSNTTVSHAYNNGQHDITISSTGGGGGGLTTLASTETPDGSRTVFTFSTASAQPSFIVSDNVWLKATTKSGTINWTWASGTLKATLSIPPQDEIYAIV